MLGGTASPLVDLDGSTELTLAPPPGLVLVVLRLGSRPTNFRESTLVALEGEVRWQSARLAQGDAEPVTIVELSGDGLAVLALPPTLQSLEVTGREGLVARARNVLGWTSDLSVTPLATSASPGRIRGLCALHGEGMVFVDGR